MKYVHIFKEQRTLKMILMRYVVKTKPAVPKVKGHNVTSVGEDVDVSEICGNCFDGNANPCLRRVLI